MDDIDVHGSSQLEDDHRIKSLKSGLKLNKNKCMFQEKKIKFLGHLISGEGVKVHPTKIDAIKGLNPPTNINELWIVLGMLNFLTNSYQGHRGNLKSIEHAFKKRYSLEMGYPTN